MSMTCIVNPVSAKKNIFKCTNIGSSVNLDINRNMENNNTETSVIVDPKFVIEAVLDDKLDSTGAKLLSNSQYRLIKTLKDKDEK
jgi:hypothetical protein